MSHDGADVGSGVRRGRNGGCKVEDAGRKRVARHDYGDALKQGIGGRGVFEQSVKLDLGRGGFRNARRRVGITGVGPRA